MTTKQQQVEKANNDCIGEECDGHCNADDEEEWVYDPSGKFKIKKEDKCFCDDCYNYGGVEWKAMECFVCRDCANTIMRNVKKFTKQWEE